MLSGVKWHVLCGRLRLWGQSFGSGACRVGPERSREKGGCAFVLFDSLVFDPRTRTLSCVIIWREAKS